MGWKQQLWPEWQIEQSIGSGAYGTVYKIKRQDIGGTYYAALKVISFPHEKKDVETFRDRCMTDAQISAYYHGMVLEIAQEVSMMERLKGNTNIVSYEDHKIVPHKHDLGWDIMIRMELLTSLPEYVRHHKIDEKEACKLGIDICSALIICEREKIIHRDIKPGNVFVSDFGDYKLGDFSLAKHTCMHSDASGPQGTYAYMAPEVYRNQAYDFTIDIYALGLILYRLLNRGRGPFQPLPPAVVTTDISEKANQQRLSVEVLPKPADASAPMAQIILKACAHDPERRYKSAEEMQKALIRCNASQSAIHATKQISDCLKKAATVLQDSCVTLIGAGDATDSETDRDMDRKEHVRETVENGKTVEKKTMQDFFSTAGDL